MKMYRMKMKLAAFTEIFQKRLSLKGRSSAKVETRTRKAHSCFVLLILLEAKSYL